jgi:hypothetical protein
MEFCTPESLIMSMASMSVAPNADLMIAANASPDASLLRSQLMGLVRALYHSEASDYHKILHNLEFASFVSGWLARESWKDVRNITDVVTLMGRCVHHLLSNSVATAKLAISQLR